MYLSGRVERFEKHLAGVEHDRRLIVDRKTVLAFQHIADYKSGMPVFPRGFARADR